MVSKSQADFLESTCLSHLFTPTKEDYLLIQNNKKHISLYKIELADPEFTEEEKESMLSSLVDKVIRLTPIFMEEFA